LLKLFYSIVTSRSDELVDVAKSGECKMSKFVATVAVLIALGTITPAFGDTKVELKQVHMCCEGCAKEVAKILNGVKGVSEVKCDQEATTATFRATDDKVAQLALDALAADGFHGDTGGAKGYAFKNDSGVKSGKVKSLTVTGFHNSCGGCVVSFRAALKDVKGVTGASAKAKVSMAEVTGEFDAVELVTALNKAGFHVKVKQ
jgi:mercuric ion binding protein